MSSARRQVPKQRHKSAKKLDPSQKTGNEPIAIVGIGCRYPGASDPDEFWRLVRDGVDVISEVPKDRFDINDFYGPGEPGKTSSRMGGFLETFDQFDPYFFGISPREAAQMDPQQRLLLEVAWEAFENAGQLPDRITGGRTGVFVGVCASDFNGLQLFRSPASRLNLYSVTGGTYSVLSGRLSYALGLEGPSLTVDTACSSSLVAVHLAMLSIRAGDCDLAVAGGVNLVVSPELSICFSQAKMLAPDGRCKAFDSRGDGFVRSDGVGLVVLKSLSRAVADGDSIYAVILGSAVNNDGHSDAMMMPDRRGQEAVLRVAYRNAGIAPGDVQYVEAHGTGTSVGDPVEASALGAVLGEGRKKDQPCIIGSVKTNFGHTEGASGVAGLIKVALSLKHRTIPPSLHVQELNPKISWADLSLTVQREAGPWPVNGEPARAGVSSFGISGTNAHLVLQEAPDATANRDIAAIANQPEVLLLSGHSSEALSGTVRAYRSFLGAPPQEMNSTLRDICYTASVRRAHLDHRLALVGKTREEFCDLLDAFLQETTGGTVPAERSKLVFVFSGQGSQWLGMGRQLLQDEPVFRESIERCEQAFSKYVDWSLLAELSAAEAGSRLQEVDVVQPAIFAVQVSLAALWRSWGIEPDAVLGQSMGEVAAAYVAGALSLEDAACVICRRSQLVKTSASGQGAMAVVGLSFQEAERALAGYEDQVSIAVSSSPSSTVLSGAKEALKDILQPLQSREIFNRWINVDYASHSPHMDVLRNDLMRALEGLQPHDSTVPIYSTVTAQITPGSAFDASYWFRNLRAPVLFSTMVQQLVTDGHDIFLEVSPHPVLLSAIQQNVEQVEPPITLIPSLRSNEEERLVMLQSLGQLHCLGRPVDWKTFYTSGQCVRLPRIAWQRERFWLDESVSADASSQLGRRRSATANSGHPILGYHFRSSIHSGTHFWEMELSGDSGSYLSDHRVHQSIVLPAAAYVAMALDATRETMGVESVELTKMAWKQALVLPETGARRVQLVISSETPGRAAVQVLSQSPEKDEQSWILHATANVRWQPAGFEASETRQDLEQIQARCQEKVSRAAHYQDMTGRGLPYGPSFQSVESIWRGNGEAIGRVHLPENLIATAAAYPLHPVLLDAAFQVAVATLPDSEVTSNRKPTWLPVGLESLRVHAVPGPESWGHARLRPADASKPDLLEGDILLLDETGKVLVEAKGLKLQRLLSDESRTNDRDWFYEVEWRLDPRPDRPATSPKQKGTWIVFVDGRPVGEALASLIRDLGDSCVMISAGDDYRMTAPDRYELKVDRPEDFRQLLRDVLDVEHQCRGVIHLTNLGATGPESATLSSLDYDLVQGCGSVLHLVQALGERGGAGSLRLFLVTSEAQPIGAELRSVSVSQSPMWGLARVIANEHPELRCTALDLSATSSEDEIQSLVRELYSDDRENQIALRGKDRFVARLVRCSPENDRVRLKQVSGDDPFRVDSNSPGILDQLILRGTSREKPGPGKVEIRVRAAGLNFSDVMKAMGIYPGLPEGPMPLGIECAGVIAAVGEGVEGLAVGDEVMAVAHFSFGSYVTVSAHLVIPKPAHLSMTEAATIPIAFLTAYYALHYLGRLEKGERVLIHSASGGVGLAAVQLAQRAGAQILATAGTSEKRELLRSLGIDCVMDSRSLDFADEVMQWTGGEGVDIVLNSLAGEAIGRGLSVLRNHGRFIELGKRDIYQNSQLGLASFKRNVSFLAVDLDATVQDRPAFVGSLLREFGAFVNDGVLKPLPYETFPISKVSDAFRYMTRAQHVGKIILSFDEKEVMVAPSSEKAAKFQADGTYLITGGLGGLGLSVAGWMIDQGARHFVLTGRSGAAGTAEKTLEAWRGKGVEIEVVKADIADEEQVMALLAKTRASMPPLRGVIHAAGILDDGILLQLDLGRFRKVMAPKVSGAWNLHRHTLTDPLDYFVLFSSAATILGNPAQGNYSAANAFMDALVHERRRQGRPALSINWGPWSEVGLAAARANRGQRLAERGFGSITPNEGVEVFGQLLDGERSQVCVMRFDMRQWQESYPTAAESPLLAELGKELIGLSPQSGEKQTGPVSIRHTLETVEAGRQRRSMLESHIRDQVGQVLRIPATRIDPHKPLGSFGLDSLMAVELRTRLQKTLGVTLPATMIWNHPTIVDLTPHVAQTMGIVLEAPSAEGDSQVKAPVGDRPRLEDAELALIVGEASRLSEVELRQLLSQPAGSKEDS